MHFKEILASITGVSGPIFGLQWKPVVAEISIACDLLRELEDKRVLYRPIDMEGTDPCLQSVFKIRDALTNSLKQIDSKSPLYKQVEAMRRACRAFCDVVGASGFNKVPNPVQQSILARELSRLRNSVGRGVGEIAIAYGLDIEDELAAAIPFNNIP